MTDLDTWATLRDAGVTPEDVELVVQHRVAVKRAGMLEEAPKLRHAAQEAYNVKPGDDVTDGDQFGRGAKITATDIAGAQRVLSVLATRYENAEVDVDEIRRYTLAGMVRRTDESDESTIRTLIERAREWDADTTAILPAAGTLSPAVPTPRSTRSKTDEL